MEFDIDIHIADLLQVFLLWGWGKTGLHTWLRVLSRFARPHGNIPGSSSDKVLRVPKALHLANGTLKAVRDS